MRSISRLVFGSSDGHWVGRLAPAFLACAFLSLMSAGVALADDLDGDGVDDTVDNCPSLFNSGQENLDADASGDICDSDTVVVTALNVTTSRIFLNLRVAGGGALTADAELTVTGNMTVESGGTVTHSPRLLAGLVLHVGGTLDVQDGGLIDLSQRGLRGGGESIFTPSAEAFDPVTGQIVAGGIVCHPGGAGASHGGLGAMDPGSGDTTNPAYGLVENPVFLGSGGGSCRWEPEYWGHGGGRLTLDAAALTLNGMVRANGGASGHQSGGGSGGSVLVHAGSISGAGTVQANGGTANFSYSGAGGGGRIAIYYDSISLPSTNLMAQGGSTFNAGGAGTVFLKDNAQAKGDLIVDNGNADSQYAQYTPLRTELTSFRSVTIRNRGRLRLTAANTEITSDDPVVLISNSALRLEAGVTLNIPNPTGFDVEIGNGCLFDLNEGAVLGANEVRVKGTFNAGADFSVPLSGTWLVEGGILNVTGSTFVVPSAYDFELTAGGTVNLLGDALFEIPMFDSTNMNGGTFHIGSGATLAIAADAATIGSGVTLSKDGKMGDPDEIGSLTVLSGGVVTHSERFLPGLSLNVTDLLEVQTGGAIDVSGKGLRGGNWGFGGDGCGEGFDLNGNIVLNCNPGASAGYGGWGDGLYFGNPPYGYLEDPAQLGSGGGPRPSGGGWGGHGGGRIRVTTPSLTLNGSIRANGVGGEGRSGGAGGSGSGGAIHLMVPGALTGNGNIEAKGGVLGGYLTPGGGGRIAIYTGFLGLPATSILASGGSWTGGAGTVYLKETAQTAGDLIIDNGNGYAQGSVQTPLRTTLSTFRSVVVRSHGRLEIASALTPRVWVDDLTVDGFRSAVVGAAADPNGMRISVSGALNLSNGGRIEANGSGLRGGRRAGNGFGLTGEAFDSLGLAVVSGSAGGSGGSYGGLGGGPSPNSLYGDLQNPQHVGSGGSVSEDIGLGGSGGGRIWVDAEACHIPAGTGLSANGSDAADCSIEDVWIGCWEGGETSAKGGGSGGSIRLDCVHIDGAGSLSANGGSGVGLDGGHGGGGGRVACNSPFPAFTGTIEALGGGATGAGEPGAQGTGGSCAPLNTRPIADAGPDQSVLDGTLVTLDGSGSFDPNNDALTYLWQQITGPSISLNLTDPVHPTFVAPDAPCAGATLSFQLVVQDVVSASFPDAIEVDVTSGTDADGDTFSSACDCDDTNSDVYPAAPQLCDGINNDCSDPQWPALAASELDPDGDLIPDCADNCPLTPNESQENGSGSSCGDACDPAPLNVRFTPRTLNKRSEGLYVKAHLRLGSAHTTASFDPNQPILLSVAGGAPIADLARQVVGNGIDVSFSRQDVAAVAPLGEAVEFRLSGGLTYACAFEGVDQVRVIEEGNLHSNESDWSSIVADAPRADLDNVRSNGNGNLGSATCLQDYQSNYDFSTNTDPDVPPAGKVFVYLFKFCNGTPNCSYGQTSSGQERTVGSGGCP